MNKKKIDEESVINILKQRGLEKPSEQFSNHLVQVVVSGYRKNRVVEYTAEKWLGKFILAVLVLFNLLFFYYLDPFSIQPVLFISITAFVFGLCILIVLVKKFPIVPFMNETHID